jgi:hypothetical protein
MWNPVYRLRLCEATKLRLDIRESAEKSSRKVAKAQRCPREKPVTSMLSEFFQWSHPLLERNSCNSNESCIELINMIASRE